MCPLLVPVSLSVAGLAQYVILPPTRKVHRGKAQGGDMRGHWGSGRRVAAMCQGPRQRRGRDGVGDIIS
jgi:hypothetical protein